MSRPKKHDVRKAIVAAAVREFTAHGYIHASLSTIAERAGYTKGAVYSNFSSKPELFVTACETRLDRERTLLLDPIAQTLAEIEGAEELAERLSTEIARVLTELAPWQIAVDEFRALARTDKRASAAYEQLMSGRIAIIADACSLHRLTQGRERADIEAFARGLFALINTLCLETLAVPADPQANRQALRFFLEGFFS
ncbi:MAG: TetR family transcriptional regulator [Flaviflexus sp.]|nr:TetR family transcriptional regulator [Flaviflexus sp.]